ncbi:MULTISPECIES: transglycosylase SLT domain-containing protein [Burkholderia]|uniref:Puatative invasion protein n=1 Tax=Burkholderia cenocepacia (strain ATCC BAA-245 / DSM 16553 / LMG 16656 / NCTC 13227 / J2315 / CF5610) TaxID=216591 RepID=B4E687_BURCJ|nr:MULTISPECIES: transglycosylase SLT domain-containing protein [Burkholderia]KIS47667.1 conjugal transfer family protein [Burkholderia cepacia]ERI29867.1 transglycosylase SLT domain protein [Burkholderia cenocepacia BC7]KKI79422.1 lytic transglycosylase [Burkholderia cenocepacia]MBG0862690.1 transglycosylase SLT domain-containing protein [Burkholderia sp. 9779_493]MBR8383022.1 transglycosylase SLT domain-containing protein [Burkholderia cenocepacia]
MPRHTTRPLSRDTLTLASTIALSCALCGVARADCLDDAAAFQHVSVSLMRGIAQVESGMNPNAVNTNTNGTVDIGLMQINSTWLPTLAREGITRESLFDACTNAYVGAWILSQNIRQLGPNWNAIGAYNSASPDKRLAYARKVYDAIRTMPDSPDTPMPILPPSFTPPQQAQTYNPFASLSVSAPPVTRARTVSPAPPPPPQGGPAGPAGTYNFGWTVTGADQAKPTQVFDDGARIYVQFSDMKHVPAIFTETSAGRVLMSWELQFPYAVVTRPAQTLIFQLGPFEARAQRGAAAAGMTAQAGTAGAATAGASASASASKKSAGTAANTTTNAAANTAAKRTASADALWYVNTPSTSGTATASPSTANVPATLPTAVTSNTPPPAPAQAPAAAAQPSRVSADALWYISK